jgi:hypothetical protein
MRGEAESGIMTRPEMGCFSTCSKLKSAHTSVAVAAELAKCSKVPQIEHIDFEQH